MDHMIYTRPGSWELEMADKFLVKVLYECMLDGGWPKDRILKHSSGMTITMSKGNFTDRYISIEAQEDNQTVLVWAYDKDMNKTMQVFKGTIATRWQILETELANPDCFHEITEAILEAFPNPSI